MTNKKFVVVVGKSASGKTTFADYLVKKLHYKKYITETTRPMRVNETKDDYNFISEKKFLNKLDKGKYIEYNVYKVKNNGKDDIWYYGTPIIRQGLFSSNKKYVIVLTLDGAIEFKKHYGEDNCLVVYFDCSDEVREYRARQRGSFDIQEWNRRLKADEDDFPMDKVVLHCDKIINTENKTMKKLLEELND